MADKASGLAYVCAGHGQNIIYTTLTKTKIVIEDSKLAFEPCAHIFG